MSLYNNIIKCAIIDGERIDSRTLLNPYPQPNYPPVPVSQQPGNYPPALNTSPPSPYYNPSPPQWSPAKSPYMGNPGAVDANYFNQGNAYGQTRQKVLNRRSVRQVSLLFIVYP